jgi:hypothetical protein
MITTHANIEIALVSAGVLICGGLLIAKVVLLAYDDLRRTWKKIKEG